MAGVQPKHPAVAARSQHGSWGKVIHNIGRKGGESHTQIIILMTIITIVKPNPGQHPALLTQNTVQVQNWPATMQTTLEFLPPAPGKI
jgi:hypothetical protein